MYIEDGEETLIRFVNTRERAGLPAGTHQVAVSQETLAHYMNDPHIEVIEEVMVFTRLPQDDNGLYDPQLRRA
jgi:hypothetical protein